MAKAVIEVEQFDEIIECSLCQNVYTDPRSLPCVHTFCLECISDWESANARLRGSVTSSTCPVCGDEFTIPDDGIASLPKNTFVGKLLALKQLSDVRSGAKFCSVCSSSRKKQAKVYCVDCAERYCDCCYEVHSKMKATSSHRTLDISDLSRDDLTKCMQSKCDKHQDRDLEIYCFECKKPLCLLCSVTQHKSHATTEVSEVVEGFRNQMTRNINRLVENVENVSVLATILDVIKKDVTDRTTAVKNEIRSAAEKQKARIDRDTERLLQQLSEAEKDKLEEVDGAISEAQQCKAMVDSLISYYKKLMKIGSSSDVTAEAAVLDSRTTELVNQCEIDASHQALADFTVTFLPNDVLSKSTENSVGKFNTDDGVFQLKSSSATPPEEPVDNSSWDTSLDDAFTVIPHTDQSTSDISHVTSNTYHLNIPPIQRPFNFLQLAHRRPRFRHRPLSTTGGCRGLVEAMQKLSRHN